MPDVRRRARDRVQSAAMGRGACVSAIMASEEPRKRK
jgi:hypothetical protein